MKKEKYQNYAIRGIDERCLDKWIKMMRNDLKIFSNSKLGNRDIIITIKLTKFEAFNARIQLFIYNFKNRTKLKISKLKGSI